MWVRFLVDSVAERFESANSDIWDQEGEEDGFSSRQRMPVSSVFFSNQTTWLGYKAWIDVLGIYGWRAKWELGEMVERTQWKNEWTKARAAHINTDGRNESGSNQEWA